MADIKVKLIFDDEDNTTFEYDRISGLKSLSLNTESKVDTNIDYSVKSNSGSLNIKDISKSLDEKYDSIYTFLLFKIKYSHINIEISLDGTVVSILINNGKIQYNNNLKEFNINIQNSLILLQNKKYKKQLDKYNINNNFSAFDLITELINISTNIIEQEFFIDDATKQYMQNVIIKYPYLEEDTIWNQLDKLCVLCQLSIYPANNKIIIERWV